VNEEAGVGTQVRAAADNGFLPFLLAGEPAAGDFRCSGCGYGVSIDRILPLCPMCGGSSWQETRP